MFHGDYYATHILRRGNKLESGRLCYESSEDAVSYNVFTELLSDGASLKQLAGAITNHYIGNNVDLYMWGGKIDLKSNSFVKYGPLTEVRRQLERGIIRWGTEPDIMLVIPKRLVVCIEAKLGSKNPIATEKAGEKWEKPKRREQLVARYCTNNSLIDPDEIFDFRNMPTHFYEQLFRNIVFAASMAKLEGHANWFVVNLRNQHVMNLKRGKPESLPMLRAVRSLLTPKYKRRVTHLTWEEIYGMVVKGHSELVNLAWYLKNKSLYCGRAFNII